MKLLVLIFFSFGFLKAHAQDFPCVKLIQACKIAGYEWNKRKSKKENGRETQLKVDCLEKLVAGGAEAVPSVIGLTQEEIEACKKYRAEKQR